MAASLYETLNIIIIIIIRNLYSAIMPLGGYRGASLLLAATSIATCARVLLCT